jgi:hypothetical protein
LQFLDFDEFYSGLFCYCALIFFVLLFVLFGCVGENFSNGHFLNYSVKNCLLSRVEMTIMEHFACGSSYLLCYRPSKTKVTLSQTDFLNTAFPLYMTRNVNNRRNSGSYEAASVRKKSLSTRTITSTVTKAF